MQIIKFFQDAIAVAKSNKVKLVCKFAFNVTTRVVAKLILHYIFNI